MAPVHGTGLCRTEGHRPMTTPETASRPRLLGKGERGETAQIGDHSVRRRHSAPSGGLRAWIAGAGPFYGAVRHEGYAAPTAWDEEGWTRPFVAGPTLAERGGMEWQEACRAFLPAVGGLDALHGAGLFHGHVHPGNLLFRDGSLVLVDGGWSTRLSRACGRELPGTLGYLPPEVLLGRAIEPRTDLYPLGACLFFAMTRLLPWDAPTQEALFRMHLAGRVRRLRSLVADAPADLERLLVAMLAPTPCDRPRHAEEVACELRRFLGLPNITCGPVRGAIRAPLVARTNELRALRLALVDTCLREKDDAQGPLLLPGPKRIEREEGADSVEGLTGEQSISASALSVRQPMQAVVVSEEATPQQGVHLRPMNGGVLLIAGEEGTGKTRLVEEVEQFALAEGVEFVVGHCPQRPMRPLDPLAEILETLLAREPWEGPREALPPLARCDESGEPPTEFAALDAARAANFDAVARFLVDRARRAPLALCVEDLHYADGSVCALFLHVVRALRIALHEGGGAEGRPEARADLPRLFLLATYDPTAGAPRAEELLKAMREIDAIQVVATLPLNASDRLRAFDALLAPDVAERVQAEAARARADKPLAALALARSPDHAASEGDVWKRHSAGAAPWTSADLERLSVMAAPCPASETSLAKQLALRRAGLADAALGLDGPMFAPWHDWVQRMAYSAAAERRKAHHAACADGAARDMEREWHRMKGGVATERDCHAALACLGTGDWELAETLLEALRQALGGKLPPVQTRWLARAQSLSGYGFQATSLIRDSGHGDPETTRLLQEIQGREGQAEARARESKAGHECAQSQDLMWNGEPAEAAETALKALRLARERGPVAVIPEVFLQMGRLYRFAAQFGSAIHCFRRAARMWRDLGQRESYGTAVALLAEAFRAAGSAESAAKAEAEVRAATPRIEDPFLQALARLAQIEAGNEVTGECPPVLASREARARAQRTLAGAKDVREAIAEQAEAAGDVEGAWIAHAWLAEMIREGPSAEFHRRRAAELVMASYASLPEELKRVFLRDHVRRKIVEA